MPVGRAGSRDPPRCAYTGEAQPTCEGYKTTPSKGKDLDSDRYYPPLWLYKLFVRLRN